MARRSDIHPVSMPPRASDSPDSPWPARPSGGPDTHTALHGINVPRTVPGFSSRSGFEPPAFRANRSVANVGRRVEPGQRREMWGRRGSEALECGLFTGVSIIGL